MIRSIIIASLSIPILIFIIFFGIGVAFLVYGLFDGSGFSNGWFAMLYAGLIYSYLTVLMSSIPTLVLGTPAAFLAQKYNSLNAVTILVGATALGALFLPLGLSIYAKSFEADVFWWAMPVGAFGGLFNGYVFFSRLKPNKHFKADAQKAARPLN